MAIGAYKGKETGETALFRTLMDRLKRGDVALGDRYFASYFGIAMLVQRGVDGLFRLHQKRKVNFQRGRRLGVEDHVVEWTKPQRPAWMDKELYASIPETMLVRELRVHVEQKGFRVNELVLATTMVDDQEYSKEELADLFLERWNIELDLLDQGRHGDGRATLEDGADGGEGDLDASPGVQSDPRLDRGGR